MLDPVSPLPALAILLEAWGVAHLLVRQQPESPGKVGRFTSIDGLRGYLALCVFLHHACVWYFYLKAGQWVLPPSRLYTHLGESSVALFFMITGFLFFSKILKSRLHDLQWDQLYLSRLMRLGPLYLVVVLLLFVVVGAQTHWRLNEPVPLLIKHAMEWVVFTIAGGPDVNGVRDTSIIVAQVTWSLVYEWMFYLSLPLLAVGLGSRVPLLYLVLSASGMVGFLLLRVDSLEVATFAGGIVAAWLVTMEPVRRLASRRAAALVPLGCLGLLVGFFPTSRGPTQIVLISLAFVVIACGNDLFGLLSQPASRVLGDMAYSLYLIHGLLLFLVFNIPFGRPFVSALSPLQHWILIAGVTPVLVGLCHLTWRYIERPGMGLTEIILPRLRRVAGLAPEATSVVHH
jgi:peptidoglycan/LPS O-acetylase OafA/YrhL